MALIPGFEYDIFISYSHMDNTIPGGESAPVTQQLSENKKVGWVERFNQYLKTYLSVDLGEKNLEIWWDNERLDGAVAFDDAIAKGIKKTAVMICLNSPCYISSDYCQMELDLFYNKVQSENIELKDDRKRIINVLLKNIPFEEWPEEFSGRTGFVFYDPKKGGKKGWIFDTDSEEFQTSMINLVGSVSQLIEDFVQLPKITSTGENAAAESSDPFTIYFGDVPESLEDTSDLIISALKKEKYKVIKSNTSFSDPSAFEQSVNDGLANAQLAIHLLDQYPGSKIGDDPCNICRKSEIELAMGTDIPQLIWIPKGMNPEKVKNKDYKTFLNDLAHGKLVSKELEYIDNGIEDNLKKQVFDYIQTLIAEQDIAKKEEKLNGSTSQEIFLDFNISDQSYAVELEKHLIANNLETLNSPSKDTLEKHYEMRSERMKKAKKLIVLFGNASKEWVMERLQTVIGKIAEEQLTITEVYLYMAPEAKETGEIMIVQNACELKVINNSAHGELSEKILEELMRNLKSKTVE